MANPVLTGTTNKQAYAPGEAISGTWTAVDADNATLTVRGEGVDLQGNPGSFEVTVQRVDGFNMQRVFIKETGTDLVLNQGARTFSGVVPSA